MKKTLVAGLLVIAISAQAQKTVPKKSSVAKPATQQSLGLKNLNDSVSYAIGLSVANFYHQQGIKNLNTACVTKAINDVFEGKKAQLSEAQANEAVMHYLNPGLSKNVEKGEKFLEENKKKPGVTETPSGLQYMVIKEGAGKKPAASDTVTVHYEGTLLDGTVFDSSVKRGQPATFTLNQVIKGWTEGVQMMKVGSKYKFFIPADLAYGENSPPSIPPNSVLIFEVELLSIGK